MLTRDAWTCRECGRVCDGHREAQADHIVPIRAGGARYDVANGQTLCIACHARKGHRERAEVLQNATNRGQVKSSGPAVT